MRPRFSIDSRRGRIAIGIAAAVFVIVLWVVAVDRTDQPDDLRRRSPSTSSTDRSAANLVCRFLRPVGGVLPPLSVFTALPSICPEKLPGGYASLGFVFERGASAADRRLAAPPPRDRSGRTELRRLPHRHRSRHARIGAADRARHARAPARPAALRRIRSRMLARQPAHGRSGARAAGTERRVDLALRTACCCGSGSSIG